MTRPGKLRICMLIARFHPISGGTEIQARRLALRLLFLCEEVFIVTARINGLPKFEDTDGLKVYRTAAFGQGIISSFIFFIS